MKDMQTKLDEAEQLAVQGGRKVTSRLKQKIKVFFLSNYIGHISSLSMLAGS